MAYDNTDRGALFKNDRKESEKHPDYKGALNVGGVDYELAAWLKTSNAGKKYMSLSVKPKGERDERPSQAPAPRGGGSAVDDLDDTIPFSPCKD